MSILAFGTFLTIGKIAASWAAAGISIAKLSSTSARQLLASSPNALVKAFMTLVCSVSLPTFIRQAYNSPFSPVAIRNDAGSTSAATAVALPSAACSWVTAGVATGSGFSWQPLSNAQAKAPKIIRPMMGSSAFIKLPSVSSSR